MAPKEGNKLNDEQETPFLQIIFDIRDDSDNAPANCTNEHFCGEKTQLQPSGLEQWRK